MNATSSGCWCLRILSGPAKGRAIALQHGENLVGSGTDCGVMLAGSDARTLHLIVQVGELAVTLKRVSDAPVRLNGSEVTQRRRSLIAGDEIDVGSFRLQLDRMYAQATQAADSDFAESILCEEAQWLDTPPASRARVQGRLAWVALMMCASLILLGWAAWPEGLPSAESPKGPDVAAIQQAVASFKEVEVLTLPGGHQVMVRGYVETRARRLALQGAMEPFGRRVGVSVHAVDEVMERARHYLANPAIALSYQGSGRMLLTGSSDDPEVRKRIRQLGEDLQPALIVTDRVLYGGDSLGRRGVRVSTADAARAARSTQWVAWQAELPARIVGVTDDGNGGRYIQLANGSRYYEGSVLRSGTRLDRIDSMHLDSGTERVDAAR